MLQDKAKKAPACLYSALPQCCFCLGFSCVLSFVLVVVHETCVQETPFPCPLLPSIVHNLGAYSLGLLLLTSWARLMFKNSMTLISSLCDSGRISGILTSSGKSQSCDWKREERTFVRQTERDELHHRFSFLSAQ